MASSGSLSKSKKTDRGKAERRSLQKAAPNRAGQLYKIGDVCAMTDTQPYVLRFWESEFPQLAPRKSRSGQRLYEKEDVDLVLRIKRLLYEEEYTIAGARKRLEEEGFAAPAGGPPPEAPEPDAALKEPSGPAKRMESRIRALRQELQALRKMLDS